MALRHINLTRHAANAITKSMKFYLAKLKLHRLRLKRSPQYLQKSRFLMAIKAAAPNRNLFEDGQKETEVDDNDDYYQRHEDLKTDKERQQEEQAEYLEF